MGVGSCKNCGHVGVMLALSMLQFWLTGLVCCTGRTIFPRMRAVVVRRCVLPLSSHRSATMPTPNPSRRLIRIRPDPESCCHPSCPVLLRRLARPPCPRFRNGRKRPGRANHQSLRTVGSPSTNGPNPKTTHGGSALKGGKRSRPSLKRRRRWPWGRDGKT